MERPERLFVLELALALLFAVFIFATKPADSGGSGRLLILALAGAAVGAVSWFYFPVLPLYCILVLAPVYDLFGVKIALTFLGLMTGLRTWQIHRDPTVVSLPAVFFCLWGIGSLLWVEKIDFELTGFLFNAIPNMLMAAVVAIHGSQNETIRKHLLSAVALGTILGSVILLDSWQQGRVFENAAGRHETLIRPDTFSSWAMLCAIFALSFAFEHRRVSRTGYALSIPMFVLFAVAAVLTGTRSAVLGTIFGLVMLVVQVKRIGIGSLTVVLAALSLGATAFWFPGLFDSIIGRFGTMEEDQGSERIGIWVTALQSFLSHPFAGVGWDGFSFQEGAMTHNVYLQVVVELGVVGLVLFVWWLTTLFAATLRSPDRRMLWAIMGALLFQGVFLHQFFYTYFWLALALCEAARHEEKIARHRFALSYRQTSPQGTGDAPEQPRAHRPVAI